GRLTLECSNLADDDPELAGLDARLIGYQRQLQGLLTRSVPDPSATS
nr:hypothetical protein [Pirellulales bacterium]